MPNLYPDVSQVSSGFNELALAPLVAMVNSSVLGIVAVYLVLYKLEKFGHLEYYLNN